MNFNYMDYSYLFELDTYENFERDMKIINIFCCIFIGSFIFILINLFIVLFNIFKYIGF